MGENDRGTGENDRILQHRSAFISHLTVSRSQGVVDRHLLLMNPWVRRWCVAERGRISTFFWGWLNETDFALGYGKGVGRTRHVYRARRGG